MPVLRSQGGSLEHRDDVVDIGQADRGYGHGCRARSLRSGSCGDGPGLQPDLRQPETRPRPRALATVPVFSRSLSSLTPLKHVSREVSGRNGSAITSVQRRPLPVGPPTPVLCAICRCSGPARSDVAARGLGCRGGTCWPLTTQGRVGREVEGCRPAARRSSAADRR